MLPHKISAPNKSYRTLFGTVLTIQNKPVKLTEFLSTLMGEQIPRNIGKYIQIKIKISGFTLHHFQIISNVIKFCFVS